MMPSIPERSLEPQLSDPRSEPNLQRPPGRASARLLRPRREAMPQALGARLAEPAEPATALPERLSVAPGERLTLSAEDRIILPSAMTAPHAAGRAGGGVLRMVATTVVVALALYGAFTLARLLLGF